MPQIDSSSKLKLTINCPPLNSTGGSTAFWFDSENIPSTISTRIPAPSGVQDILIVLQELAEVYGLTDVYQELEVRANTSDNKSDGEGLFPVTTYITLQHVCRFTDGTTVDVSNSKFAVTMDENNNIVTISSSFQPTDCVYPSGHLTSGDVQAIFPGITSNVVKSVFPTSNIYAHLSGKYVFRFAAYSPADNADRAYMIDASNGNVLQSYPISFHSYGTTRKVNDYSFGNQGPIKCEDSAPNETHNSYGGAQCTTPFKELYDSLYWGHQPLGGSALLSQLFGVTLYWGNGSQDVITSRYDGRSGPIPPPAGIIADTPFGNYRAVQGQSYVNFGRYAAQGSSGGVTLTSRQTDASGQPLPGIGGAVDIVGHELGHGYIHSFLAKAGFGRAIYDSPSPGHSLGRAVTEGMSDIFGKVAEAKARFVQAECDPNIEPNHVQNGSSVVCGSWAQQYCNGIYCKRGTYCKVLPNNPSAFECKPCLNQCQATSSVTNVVNWDVGATYLNGENIFQNNAYMRRLWDKNIWTLQCPDSTFRASADVQFYQNAIWFAGMVGSYGSAADPLYNNQRGVIRNHYDYAAQQAILIETIKHLPEQPSVKRSFAAWGAALLRVIDKIPVYAYNAAKTDNAAGLIFTNGIWYSKGKCDPQNATTANLCNLDTLDCCNPNSPFICLRTKP